MNECGSTYKSPRGALRCWLMDQHETHLLTREVWGQKNLERKWGFLSKFFFQSKEKLSILKNFTLLRVLRDSISLFKTNSNINPPQVLYFSFCFALFVQIPSQHLFFIFSNFLKFSSKMITIKYNNLCINFNNHFLFYEY